MDTELRTFFPLNSRHGDFIVLTPAFRATTKGRYRPWMVTVFDTVQEKVRVVRAVAIVPDFAGRSSTAMRRAHKGLYQVWTWIRGICYLPWDDGYKNFGARGIKVCPEWRNFDIFACWSLDQYQPGFRLERIDENGPFAPSNCVWVNPSEPE